MRHSIGIAIISLITVLVALLASVGNAGLRTSQECMDGIDTSRSSASAEVYCGPASALVVTSGTSRLPIKAGTCVRGRRGAGSFDLYLGVDTSGDGPSARHLHLFRLTARAKPGLYMEDGRSQWAASSTIKLTLTPRGGSFSGTALRRTNGKTSAPRAPIDGTFRCR